MTRSNAAPISKVHLQKFEALLDAELARRSIYGFVANETLMLACNVTETVAARDAGCGSVLNDGVETFASHLVSGRPGTEPDVEQLLGDLVFGSHYHRVRDLLYYSYNSPGSVDWTFSPGKVQICYHNRSLPRQFFTTLNEWYFLSAKTFDGLDPSNEIERQVKGSLEFELGDHHPEIIRLLAEHADRKLSSYFSILSRDANIDLGGYSYQDFHAVYRVMMIKSLYHRYQAKVNEAYGCVYMPADELKVILAEETGMSVAKVELVLHDLVYDAEAATGRVDASYFSLMREGAPQHRIIMRPYHFSRAEGLVQLLRVVGRRRPKDFLSNVSNALGAQFVKRVKAAFEAQGFTCRSDLSLRGIDPNLPDIDLVVIAEEPSLGFVLFVCEVKSPLPPLWAKDQLRALASDSIAKAFRQAEAIGAFMQQPHGVEFIRSILPADGIQHFDDFVVAIHQLIITSDNAGMFFDHEETPIINFRTLERLLERSDGDILHILTCIRTYSEGADSYSKAVMTEFQLGDLTVSYEGFTPTALMDFPQNVWRSDPGRQQMIDDFVAGGHHPFDCLEGRRVLLAAPPASTDPAASEAEKG